MTSVTGGQPKLFPATANGDYATAGLATDGSPAEDGSQALEELRVAFEKLRAEATVAFDTRARQISDGVKQGGDYVAQEIRREPVVAIGLALLLGVLVGVVVTHKSSKDVTWQDTAERYQQTLKHEMDHLMAKAKQASYDTRDAARGFVPTFEKLVQNLSDMDVGSSIGPALEKGSSLFRSAWNAVTGPK